MTICSKCHRKVSKEVYARHYKKCIPEGTKGHEHFKLSRSFPVDPVSKKRITYNRN